MKQNKTLEEIKKKLHMIIVLLIFALTLLALRITLLRIEKKIDNFPICVYETNPYWDCPQGECFLEK